MCCVVCGGVFKQTPMLSKLMWRGVCSRNLFLSFDSVEADGRPHEAVVFKPLVLDRHRDSSLELCSLSSAPLSAPIWRAQTLPIEPSQQVKPQSRSAPRMLLAGRSAGRALRVLVALQNETPIPATPHGLHIETCILRYSAAR